MPRLAHNPETGETLVQDPLSGEWSPASGGQIQAAQTGPGEAALVGAGRTLSQFVELAKFVANPRSAFQNEPVESEIFSALQAESPLATLTGGLIPELALGGPVAARVGRSVAERIAARQAAQAAPQGVSGRFTRDLGDVVRQNVPGVAGRTLGSAADQLQAGLQSIPIARAFANIPLERRAGEFNAMVVRAMGGDPRTALDRAGRLSRQELNTLVRGIEQRFQDSITDGEAIVNVADDFIELRHAVKSIPTFERRLFGDQIDAGQLTVSQLMQWRRQLNKVSGTADNFAQRELAKDLIEQIDNSVSPVVDKALHAKARAQWRMLFALEGGKSYSKQSINPTSFISSLKRIYGRQFSLQRTDGLTDEIKQVLEAADELETLGVTIPSSGTAERLGGAALLFGTGVVIANEVGLE